MHLFDVLEAHTELAVTVRSEVWTPEGFEAPGDEPSLADRWDFLHGTRYIALEGAIGELAASVASTGDALETSWMLMGSVRGSMRYEPGSTDVHTRAHEALADGKGLCQDFAHVFIGACRARGTPARCVSGYLYDPGNGDRSASHAWVDVFDPERGWVSLDPTHDIEQADHYVRIGVGRDYADVAPTRGVYKGNASEELDVLVKITEL